MAIWVWNRKHFIHVVVRTDLNMLVVGVWFDKMRELKFKLARQSLYLSTLVDGVRIINRYKYERLIGCCLKQIINRVWI